MQRSLLHRTIAEIHTGGPFVGGSSSLIRWRSTPLTRRSTALSTTLVRMMTTRNRVGTMMYPSFLSSSKGVLHSSLETSMRQKSTAEESGMAKGGTVEASEGTHPDFQPRAITTDCSEEEINMIKKDIRDTIREENVVIFIKGVPEAPMCAFSKKLVDIVECLGIAYTSFDVLAHPVVRSYVKEVSEWPTIPQLFIKGEFVGGLDIVLKMAQSGDLQMLLDSKGIEHRDQKKEK